MLTDIHPKLPMRNQNITRGFYLDQLGFRPVGDIIYPGYLMLQREAVELHFFEFPGLNPRENYGQIYLRTDAIDQLYEEFVARKVEIHPNGHLSLKPWGQKEFAILDPDHNLLTFGQAL